MPDLRSTVRPGMRPVDRFWLQVNLEGPVHPIYGKCWQWTGSDHAGRGGWILVDGIQTKASRFSWEIHNGKIVNGLKVLHKCDNPSCVNPNHLFLGTSKDNSQDMASKGRARGGVSGERNSSTKHPELRQGERNGNSRLTSASVSEIRSMYANGSWTYRELALLFGVSEVTVARVVRYRMWKEP